MIGNGFIGPNYRHAKDCVFCNDCVMRGETTFVVGAILEQEQQEQGEPMVTITVEQQTSLLAHIGAGLCSGVAQSIVMTGWEYLNTRDIYKHFGPRAVHPTIGYASLFGS